MCDRSRAERRVLKKSSAVPGTSYFHHKLKIEPSKSSSPHSVNCPVLFIYFSSETSDTDSSKCESSVCASLLDYPVNDLSTGETLSVTSFVIHNKTVFGYFDFFFISRSKKYYWLVLFVVTYVLLSVHWLMNRLHQHGQPAKIFRSPVWFPSQMSSCKKADHQKRKENGKMTVFSLFVSITGNTCTKYDSKCVKYHSVCAAVVC